MVTSVGEERCISNLLTVGEYIVQVQYKSNLFRCIAFNHYQEKTKFYKQLKILKS